MFLSFSISFSFPPVLLNFNGWNAIIIRYKHHPTPWRKVPFMRERLCPPHWGGGALGTGETQDDLPMVTLTQKYVNKKKGMKIPKNWVLEMELTLWKYDNSIPDSSQFKFPHCSNHRKSWFRLGNSAVCDLCSGDHYCQFWRPMSLSRLNYMTKCWGPRT